MKSFFATIGILILVGLIVVVSVQAATTAAVTATVTVQSIAISLNQTSFAYGNMANNTASTTLGLWSGAGITATNDGSLANFDIYGANTTGWTLAAATSTNNIYAHRFCNDTDNVCTTPWANYTAFTASTVTLKNGVVAAGTVVFQLQMHTPNPSTVYTEQSASVTVQASG